MRKLSTAVIAAAAVLLPFVSTSTATAAPLPAWGYTGRSFVDPLSCDIAGYKYVEAGWYPAYDCRNTEGSSIWYLYVFTG